jgi:hypothetical protein
MSCISAIWECKYAFHVPNVAPAILGLGG